MTKTIEAPPQQRVAIPRDCSFHTADWNVLSRSWFPVARTDEVKDRPAKARLLDVDLVVYRTGQVARVARDLCFPRGAALSMGWVEGDVIVCPYHGFRYGPDGRCAGVPAHPDMATPPKLRIITFPTVERFGLMQTPCAIDCSGACAASPGGITCLDNRFSMQ